MNDCQLWPGSVDHAGYGRKWQGRPIGAHRWTWEQTNGPIPAGMVIMHTCDNPSCVNLDHLRLGTQADNLADMRAKQRGRKPPIHIGEANNNTKLTAEQVREIRASSDKGTVLAARFGVSSATVYAVRHEQTWRHLCA